MKTKVLFTLCLASVVVFFSSFMVREKEEALKPSVDYYLLQGDKAFASFILNLQKMEALVYIPKSRLVDAKGLGVSLLSRDMAAAVNKQIAGSGDFVQVYPSGDSGERVSLNFEKLNMISYVRQDKATSKAVDMFNVKLDSGNMFPKVESVAVNAARPEELQIKVEGSKVMQAYVPVTIN